MTTIRKSRALLFAALLAANGVLGQTSRFIIDDDEFLEQVTRGSGRLAKDHKLLTTVALREQVRTCSRTYQIPTAPISQEKLAPPELYERLRESTLAIGTYFKCKACPDWHFNASSGFVVANGIVSTCCHVVTAEEPDAKEAYLVAADSSGRVFPVQSVLAADQDADTCFVRVDTAGLKPLPLRAQARPGEKVFCLSHPGGYHFMFTEGIVARLNRQRNAAYDSNGKTNGMLSRPVLFLNITAEFAPGSSGAPVVDDAGNVLGQVASITDAGDPGSEEEHVPPSPSVPIRYCTATEEILRLMSPAVTDLHNPRTVTRKKNEVRHSK